MDLRLRIGGSDPLSGLLGWWNSSCEPCRECDILISGSGKIGCVALKDEKAEPLPLAGAAGGGLVCMVCTKSPTSMGVMGASTAELPGCVEPGTGCGRVGSGSGDPTAGNSFNDGGFEGLTDVKAGTGCCCGGSREVSRSLGTGDDTDTEALGEGSCWSWLDERVGNDAEMRGSCKLDWSEDEDDEDDEADG